MKFKENKPGMNQELYDLFIDLIQLELNKIALVASGKYYFEKTGLILYKDFMCKLKCHCVKFKESIESYLVERDVEIPEFTIPAIKVNFESKEIPFEELVKLEENCCKALYDIVKKADEVTDFCAFGFAMDLWKNFKHIAEKALNAVNNNQDPNLILP